MGKCSVNGGFYISMFDFWRVFLAVLMVRTVRFLENLSMIIPAMIRCPG